MPSRTRSAFPTSLRGQVLVAPFNDAERAGAIIAEHAHELAAVIVEPLERVLLPVPGFLQALRDITSDYGIVLIFDEVVTGFPDRLGRRPGALRRRAGPGDVRQSDVRRLPDGRHRRPSRPDGAPGCATHGARPPGLGERHAERQPDQRQRRPCRARRPGAPGRVRAPAPHRRPPAARDHRHRRPLRLLNAQTPARTPSSASASPPARTPAAGKTCSPPTKTSAPLGDRAHQTRHPGQPEREVLHLDRPHRRRRRLHARSG